MQTIHLNKVPDQIRRPLFSFSLICVLGLTLSACDPARKMQLTVYRASGCGETASVSNFVGDVLSVIDHVARENGFLHDENILRQQQQYFPSTIRYYVRQRELAPGRISFQAQFNAERGEVTVYLVEFPSDRPEVITERTYALLERLLKEKGYVLGKSPAGSEGCGVSVKQNNFCN